MSQQTSKRSRANRKRAKFSGLARNTGHPSHLSGKRWRRRKKWSKHFLKDFSEQLEPNDES